MGRWRRFESGIPEQTELEFVKAIARRADRGWQWGRMRNGDGLLIVCGHAIWQDGAWWGGYPGERPVLEGHVRDGVRLWTEEQYHALAFSGGWSRPSLPEVASGAVTNSEAAGMAAYAVEAGLLPPGAPDVLLEEYGRDSFENIFFSLLAYYWAYGRWPARVGVVSWSFKAMRQYLIALGLGLIGERFRFGSADPLSGRACEEIARASIQYDAEIVEVGTGRIVDPFHRAEVFAAKRLGRMRADFGRDNERYLEAVRRAYDAEYSATGAAGIVSRTIAAVEAIAPGDGWRGFRPPW